VTTTRITVAGERPYDVVIGEQLAGELPPLLEGARQVALLYPPALRERAVQMVSERADAGFDVLRLDLPDGERAKTLAVAGRCWDALGDKGFTRTDAVVALGGGAVTDLAGFVAASWLRGVRVVHLPTTLLGMVDAAVGGKTGINTAAGKNLVGAFYPPTGVLCDLTTLATLPEEELRSGLAEVVKCGFIADPSILDVIERGPDQMAAGTSELSEVIERSVRVKADVVSQDLRESGPREYLNYGHTLAHAIERAEDYRWRHGDAVAVGLVFAAALGRRAGRLDQETAFRHREILTSLGLPTTYQQTGWDMLHETMRIDKKARGARLRFVVLDGLGRPGILDDPEPALLEAAYQEVSR
jgi:3-dehydroquinate synthase